MRQIRIADSFATSAFTTDSNMLKHVQLFTLLLSYIPFKDGPVSKNITLVPRLEFSTLQCPNVQAIIEAAKPSYPTSPDEEIIQEDCQKSQDVGNFINISFPPKQEDAFYKLFCSSSSKCTVIEEIKEPKGVSFLHGLFVPVENFLIKR